MRSSLVVAGGMIALTGVVLFVALDGEAWLALIAGGGVALAFGLVLEEVTDRVEAPPGQHFCPFCSTSVADEEERCSHCNGLQDWVTRSKPTPSQPNN
jgi:hypothetical protein